MNKLPTLAAVAGAGGVVYVVVLVALGASPSTTDVGYQPVQPVPYSHLMHAGELGIACQYCHWPVETTRFATVPSTEVCMNCHHQVFPESEKLLPVRQSHATGLPVAWVRVHDLPDYAYFDHSAHVGRGVGCDACHGRIDRVDVVAQTETLSMGWCLDCHRNPEPKLRPLDQVANLAWVPSEAPEELGRRLRTQYDINPSTDCSTCHR